MTLCSLCGVDEEYVAQDKHGRICQPCVLYAEAWFRRNNGPVKLAIVEA
jgi:hypothetical protein